MADVIPFRRESEPWVSSKVIAEHFGVSVKTVDRWRAKGAPHEPWGRKLMRYRVSDVESWLRSRAA